MSAPEPLADDADPTYTHFAHGPEFTALLEPFVALDLASSTNPTQEKDEDAIVASMGAILDYYLPLPGLLDPSLDLIVTPLMDVVASLCTNLAEGEELNENRIARVGRVVNWVVKVRGWKAVVPYFPSEIRYLSILVDLLSPSISPSTSQTPSLPHHALLSSLETWELRSILLLWLALLLTVPFNLTALSPLTSTPLGLDNPTTLRLFSVPTSELAKRVTVLSLPLLHRAGKEGAYSALVLARLFARSDATQGLTGFFKWAESELVEGDRESEANFVTSVLAFLAVLPTMIQVQGLEVIEGFIEEVLLPHLRGSRTAAGSGLVRKLAVKAKGRLWIAKLGRGVENEADLPPGLEGILDDLMGGLSDKDTIVRYSSAKYLARLSSLLPRSLSSQVVLATTSLFAGSFDEPVVETAFGTIIDPGGTEGGGGGTMGFGGVETTRGEARWHGVCLAIAEMARRGLVDGEAVGEAVRWVIKALTFDLRRASHSIGSNVRDAAAYLLWSLSRACPPSSLAPYSTLIATTLTCVALFDREVGVRRAASAAFQEGVGRLGLYPHGIDVLSKTDFYSVSVRRLAFTIAAPAVAVHEEYRKAMREHLHNIILRHWDGAMRSGGAGVLKKVLELGEGKEVDDSIGRELGQVGSLDAVNAHGAIAALAQMAGLLSDDDERRIQIFSALSTVRPAALVTAQSSDLIQSACDLIITTLTPLVLAQPTTQAILDQYIETAIKRREGEVHEKLAGVFRRLSGLSTDLGSIRPAQKQAAALCLGHIQYALCPATVDGAVTALLTQLDAQAKADVETRRNAIRSLGDLACQSDANGELLLSVTQFHITVPAFIAALDDYTTDQRGDVGSWVRIAALSALSHTLARVVSLHGSCSGLAMMPTELVTQETVEMAIKGMVRVSVEKMETVREEAAVAWARLRDAGVKGDVGEGVWEVEIGDEFKLEPNVRLRDQDQTQWFASAMPLLKTRYATALVAGLVSSIGSQVQSTSSLALTPLHSYLSSQPNRLNLATDLATALAEVMAKSLNVNRVFVPTLQAAQKLVDAGVFTIDPEAKGEGERDGEVEGVLARVVSLACRGVSRMKSIERIRAAMLLTVSTLALPYPTLRPRSIASLRPFLAHRFPRVRAMTAESLYLALSADEDVEAELEEVLVETPWTEEGVGETEADRVIALMQAE